MLRLMPSPRCRESRFDFMPSAASIALRATPILITPALPRRHITVSMPCCAMPAALVCRASAFDSAILCHATVSARYVASYYDIMLKRARRCYAKRYYAIMLRQQQLITRRVRRAEARREAELLLV